MAQMDPEKAAHIQSMLEKWVCLNAELQGFQEAAAFLKDEITKMEGAFGHWCLENLDPELFMKLVQGNAQTADFERLWAQMEECTASAGNC